jgi:hypothetical protein
VSCTCNTFFCWCCWCQVVRVLQPPPCFPADYAARDKDHLALLAWETVKVGGGLNPGYFACCTPEQSQNPFYRCDICGQA